MNFIESLKNIINPHTTDETIALAILVGGSFLLGMLVWALFFHLPKSIRLRRENTILKHDLNDLDKKYTHLAEDHRIASAKLENIETDLKDAQNQVVEQTGKVVEARNEIEDLKSQLYKAQKSESIAIEELGELKRLYKYAQQAITDSEKMAESAQAAQNQLQNQLERLKTFTLQLEQEKRQTQEENVRLHHDLEEISVASNEYEKDLQTALQQLAQHQQQIELLQSELEQNSSIREQNEALQTEMQTLSSIVHELQSQKTAIDSQLSVYTQREEAVKQEEAQDKSLMADYLTHASENMANNPFYDAIDPNDLVEDPHKVQQALAQTPAESALVEPFQEEIQALTEDEQDELASALWQAENAMQMPGFYNDIDQTRLVQPTDDGLSDEQLIEKMIKDVEAHLETSDLHRDIQAEELIENADLVDSKLAEMPAESDSEAVAEPVVVEEQEAIDMKKALDYANVALNSEGFYTDIAADKLIEQPLTEAAPTPVFDPKYKTDIEKAVVADFGRIVPRAADGAKDDLKKINGIGTFIEQKLNHLGIYTYEQVSAFDDTFITKLTAAIGFAEDAIHRDQWVMQARQLVSKKFN